MGKKQFKAESKRLLDLMINSIYTNKEIFLREIISNASDAIDKLCYISLTDDKVGLERSDYRIRITVDKDARTITVSDNGIGMSQDEAEKNLGVIAKSGSYNFKNDMSAEEAEKDDISIIGQFGVGFYSAFMVSDKVTVITKKYGEEKGVKWESTGADGYTVTECDKFKPGTDVIMHIKEDTDEEVYGSYLEIWKLKALVKKYSDYVRWPIVMDITHQEQQPTGEEDKDGKPIMHTVNVTAPETVNSMVPIWQRAKTEVTDDECVAWYKETNRDQTDPAAVLRINAEGVVSYKALLFIPGKDIDNGISGAAKKGVKLYCNGVLIMEDCDKLLHDYFEFARGVVDSPDLSLNISRELLQHDRQLKVIGNSLEKKLRADLEKLLRDDREGYEKFYENFGRAIGFGIAGPDGLSRKEALQDLLLFYSSTEKKLVTLREYVDRMPESQKYIYYAAGESAAAIDHLPQTELLKDKNYEILYLTGETDEFVLQMLGKYADKEFRSIVDGELDLGGEEQKDIDEKPELMQFVKETLGDKIKEARASRRLKTHPVCMTAGEGLSFEMEKYFKSFQMPTPVKADRILELNTDHPAVQAMEAAMTSDRAKAELYAKILYDQALLIAGLPLEDPSEYTDLVAELMK